MCQFDDYLCIEIQFRTYLQHLWATALEMRGIYSGVDLKSGVGEDYVLRFFLLLSSLFALEEHTPVCPNTSDNYMELINEIKRIDKQYNIIYDRLPSVNFIKSNNLDGYYLLDLDIKTFKLDSIYFKKNQVDKAMQYYNYLESLQDTSHNIVLVLVPSFKILKDSYLNYFLDDYNFYDKLVDLIYHR